MKSPSPLTSFGSLTLGCAILAAFHLPAQATDLTTQKLTGRWALNLSSYEMGNGTGINGSNPGILAGNESWIVVGAPMAAEPAGVVGVGAVQVFNAATGAWVRKLLPPAPIVANTAFGTAIAVSGSIAAVGAIGPNTTAGVVYIYSLSTGALTKTLTPLGVGDGGAAGDQFGGAVAISGDWVIVGAPQDDSGRGSAYFFNLKTNAKIKVQASDGAASHFFGCSIAAEGNVVIIGAPGVDSNQGAGYAYDLPSQTLIRKIRPSASAAGDGVGYSVSIHQGKVALGAPYANTATGKIYVTDLLAPAETVLAASDGATSQFFGRDISVYQGMLLAGAPFVASNRGSLYVFDLNSPATTEMQQIQPPDGGTGEFGLAVAWCGNTAVTVAPYDNTRNAFAGAVYMMRPVTRPMPLSKVTAKGDFAPGVAEINFATLGDAFMNVDGELAFVSTLTGYGSNGNRDNGVWSTLAAAQPLNMVAKSRQISVGLPILSVSKPLINQSGLMIFNALLTGTGVNAYNNQAIYKDDGTTTLPIQILRTGGSPLAMFGGGTPQGFTQVTQNRLGGAAGRIAATFTLHPGPGTPVTTTANDTGLLFFDLTNSAGEAAPPREGLGAGTTGLTYGQFTGRVAYFQDRAAYATAVTGAATVNQAIFQKKYNTAETVVVQKGDIPTAPASTSFSSFIGESVDDGPSTLFRATVVPTPVASNEGLWTSSGSLATLVMQKGVDLANTVPPMPGIRIAKFINFWETYRQTLALVQLTGTGVTAANDQALLLYQTTSPVNQKLVVLLREGDAAPGCNGATIGVISRVELEPWYGQYLVLATLAGAPIGTEQALFRGFCDKTLSIAAEQTLRRPVPVLRKGQLFNNQTGRIKSISLPLTNLTAAGAGSTGLSHAIQEGPNDHTATKVAITLDFDNGVHQIMKGIP